MKSRSRRSQNVELHMWFSLACTAGTALLAAFFLGCEERQLTGSEIHAQVGTYYDGYYSATTHAQRRSIMENLISFLESNREQIAETHDVHYLLAHAYARKALTLQSDSQEEGQPSESFEACKNKAVDAINQSPSVEGTMTWTDLLKYIRE